MQNTRGDCTFYPAKWSIVKHCKHCKAAEESESRRNHGILVKEKSHKTKAVLKSNLPELSGAENQGYLPQEKKPT